MGRYLHIGGLVAVGFDASESDLLTITHSGWSVFSTRTWAAERPARSTELPYPEDGVDIGIGPIDGHPTPITQMYYGAGEMR